MDFSQWFWERCWKTLWAKQDFKKSKWMKWKTLQPKSTQLPSWHVNVSIFEWSSCILRCGFILLRLQLESDGKLFAGVWAQWTWGSWELLSAIQSSNVVDGSGFMITTSWQRHCKWWLVKITLFQWFFQSLSCVQIVLLCSSASVSGCIHLESWDVHEPGVPACSSWVNGNNPWRCYMSRPTQTYKKMRRCNMAMNKHE